MERTMRASINKIEKRNKLSEDAKGSGALVNCERGVAWSCLSRNTLILASECRLEWRLFSGIAKGRVRRKDLSAHM